jgi:adenylate cyclase
MTVVQVTYTIMGERRTVEGAEGQTLLQIALDHSLPMEHACGGNGFCTTCLCRVEAGMEHLTPRSDREEGMGIDTDPQRLCCQTKLSGTGPVEVTAEEF